MVIEVRDLGGQDKYANASASASDDLSITFDTNASSLAISSDAEQAVKYWQSINNAQLPPIYKKVAIEAYNTQYREKRGIVRQDLVDVFGYSSKYAKKVLSECTKCKLLVHLKGRKQGRFHECFLSTEIDTFLQKQADKKNQGRTIDSSSISIIQMLINEITDRNPTFHKLMIHVKM